MHVTLDYTAYDGQPRTVYKDEYDEPFNPAPGSDTVLYSADIRVPADAAPGSGQIRAQSFCGPEEEFPPSEYVDVTIDRARPKLAVNPQKVQPGSTATLSGSGCYGSTAGTVPVTVRWPDGSRHYDVRRTADTFRLSFPVPATAGTGPASVTLDADADCPGSVLPASGSFTVFRAAPPVSPSLSPSVRPMPPALTGSPSPQPSTMPSPASPGSSSPVAAPRDSSGPGSNIGMVIALLVAAGGGLTVLLGVPLRRRLRHARV